MFKIVFGALLAAGSAAAGPVFTDRAADLPGPAHVYDGGWEHFVGGGVAVFDCNDDGLPEFLPAGGSNPSPLYLNTTAATGAALRFDRAEAQPLAGVTGVTGAYPLDMDGDGVLDLFVLRVGPNIALRGLGACRFEDATAAWGLPQADRWSTAFTATFEPGQSRPTLAIGNYVDRSDPDGPFEVCDANILLRPEGTDYGPEIALVPGHCALSALFSDWARRGRADLRLSNDRHYYVRAGAEQMWQLSPLRLLGPEDGWERVSIWGMGIASRDLNADGRPDVMLTSMGDQLLQFSDGETGFRNAPWGQGSQATRPHLGDDGRPSTGWHAQFGDVDNDGLADLFIAKGNVQQMPGNAMRDPNNLLLQQADGTFVEASVKAGVATMERSRGAALSDLNGDGLLDLIVVNRRAPLEVWENTSAGAGNWLAVTPFQDGANRFALGAWVETRTAQGTQQQEITVGGGHAGGQAGPLHFGLGSATGAEVRVIWPDGTATDWQSVTINQAITLTRQD
ncbi:CRTAC1 family protein [Fluviibacterium sp. DFM31]|uniref:CRTAC1 family protein n=1 Tax=Meridianimarinicoccus marinus TaxID=3231483 RepID=A0ABV3L6T1_9RHOB